MAHAQQKKVYLVHIDACTCSIMPSVTAANRTEETNLVTAWRTPHNFVYFRVQECDRDG